MNTAAKKFSTNLMAVTASLLFSFTVLMLAGCSDQGTNPALTTAADVTRESVDKITESDDDPIEETMQISPYKINLQSKGAAESIRAIIGLSIPGGYALTDFDFTLSFDGADVVKAYDCYYCYIDDNLIISFRKAEVLASPVTQALENSTVVAAVNGFFRVESDEDGYDTELSTVARVEIISPANSGTAQNCDM